MKKIQDENQNLIYYEMEYNGSKYRFIPKSNYWICIEAIDWRDRWTICSDELGIELVKEAESRGFDIKQILSENGCSKKRMKILDKKKKSNTSISETFFSLFDEPSDLNQDDEPSDEDPDDGFISLF